MLNFYNKKSGICVLRIHKIKSMATEIKDQLNEHEAISTEGNNLKHVKQAVKYFNYIMT